MKNVILRIAISILVVAYILRVYFVNTTHPFPVTQKYEMGAEVAIENDFVDSSDENMNGYTVTVLDTELLTINEFVEHYEIEDSSEYDYLEYVYLVSVRFRNVSSECGERGGINLSRYILQKTSFITYMDQDIYKMTNGIDIYSFSLRLGTEKDLIIPFGIDTEYIDVQQIEDGTLELVISAYPHKKTIKLSI